MTTKQQQPDALPNVLNFWVDNTAPVVQNLMFHETQLEADPPRYSTQVSLKLTEPVVNEAWSNLDVSSIKVFVDKNPLYSQPDIDEAGFWLLSQWPSNQLSVQTLDSRNALVSFTLPHRLPGHLIEVEVADQAGNSARYTLYPSGELTP